MRHVRSSMAFRITAAIAWLFAAHSLSAQPAAEAPEVLYDAGDVPEGTVIKHAFLIKNKGSSTLTISSVAAQCRCTVAKHDNVIPAGGSGRVSVDVDTTGFSGSITKSVIAATNDPDNASLRLTVTADVINYFALFPHKRFSYPNTRRSSGEKLTLTLNSPEHRSFTIQSATTGVPGLKVTFEPKPSGGVPGSVYDIHAALTPDVPLGLIKGDVVLKTDVPEMPEYKIPVSGFIVGPVAADPSSLNFMRADPADPASLTKTVSLTSEPGVTMKLGAIKSSAPIVQARTAGACEANTCRIEVTYAGGGEEIWKVAVSVETGVPQQPVIEIPVIGKAIAAPRKTEKAPAGRARP